MKIELKNVKVGRLIHEGHPYTAAVYIDGEKKFTVEQHGNGGCNIYYGDRKAIDAAEAYARELLGTQFEALDLLLAQMIDQQENDKRLKRYCKKETLFRLVDDPEDEYRRLARPYSTAVREHLADRYRDELAEIVNERFAAAA